MKFTTKITQLTIASAVSSILISGLASAIAINKTDVVVTQVAQALAPEEVNLRAKQIIVRIDGASIGSGSIIEHNGDRYKVLTNWHVMQNEGGYTVQTIDGRKHPVIPESIKQLGGLDLAVFEFTSNQNYQTAELGDSGNLNEGQIIYFGGYPGELRREDNRYYRFFTANLVGILPRSTDNGYSLIYNGEAFPGMSGGPVFNREGLVIGVHGEANVAFTGGTSNYAIPIASYQQMIAQQATPQDNLTQDSSTPDNSTANTAEATPPIAQTPEVVEEVEEIEETPEVIVEEPEVVEPEPAEPADATTAQSNDSDPEQATEALDSENISSVPTFTPAEQPETESVEITQPESTAAAEAEPETESVEVVEESASQETAAQPEAEPETEPVEVESEEIEVPTVTRKIALVSPKTGISYTKLRNLLKEGKWSEADVHTYQLVGQIVESAKRNNKRTFIELKTIAEYSCPDVRTIDYLWKKYSDDQFGFSPQQKVWKSVNQKGDFSTETWRRFATEVGWKEGEVDSGSGYLLYEQLDFEPDQAPAGHLPWWFAMSDEEQKVIKSLFSRCNLNPTLAELEAETQNNSADTAQNSNSADNDTNDAKKESDED